MPSQRRNRIGSIMTELLLGLLVATLFLPLMLKAAQVLYSGIQFPHRLQDQISFVQLRRFLNSCHSFEVDSDELVFYNEKRWTLRCSESNLYLSDGTVIVLPEVNQVAFEKRADEIWMLYYREEEWKEVLIGCE